MINENKWLESLNKAQNKNSEVISQLDHDVWIKTISKKKNYSSVKKYFFTGILFLSGLLLVSVVKNETRNLQKEINNLNASNNVLKFNLAQARLDNEVITSPENLSKLAKEHLNIDLVFYKRSQIKNLNNQSEILYKENKEKKSKKSLAKTAKLKVSKKILDKKEEIKKIKKLYSDPKKIPGTLKSQVKYSIKEKKEELKKIYQSPKDAITFEKAQRWGAVQVVKAFLGIPIVPGR